MRLSRLAMAAGFLLIAIYSRAQAAVPGDLNGNGQLDIGDAILALKIVVGLDTATPDLVAIVDVNPNPGVGGRAIGDGKVDISDVIALLRVIVHLDPPDRLVPIVAPAGPTLMLDTTALSAALAAGTSGPVAVPLEFLDAASVTVGRVSLTLTPVGGSTPPLEITQLAKGPLLKSTFLFDTNPESIPTVGVSSLLTAFVVSSASAITGSGVVLIYTIQVPAGLPPGTQYTLSLGDLSFSDKDSNAVIPAAPDVTVGAAPAG